MYPASGLILMSQRSSGLSGNSATALFALRAATLWGSSTFDILKPSYEASGVRSKIGSFFSMRRITLCRWKFAMTAAAVSPFLARRCNALVRTSSLA
jgi:hypothetical protein